MLRLTIPRTGPRPGPITDPQAVRTCTHAGISLVQGKLAALTDVEKGLVAADAELATAMDRKAVIDGALLGLKWTKAACDGFISIASEFAGPAGKVVAGGYKVGGSVAEAVSTAAAGQPVNWTKTTTGVVTGTLKSASNLAKMGKVPLSSAAQTDLGEVTKVASLGKIKVDIVHAAMKGEGVSKQGFADLATELSTMSLEYMDKEKASKVVKIGKAMIDTGISMYKSYDEFQKERAADREALRSMKQMLSNQLGSVRRRISQLEREFASCAPPPPPPVLP